MMGSDGVPGVNIRAVEELFELCGKDENNRFTFSVTMLEVYNEHVSGCQSRCWS